MSEQSKIANLGGTGHLQLRAKKVWCEVEGNNDSYTWIRMLSTHEGQESLPTGAVPPGRTVARFIQGHNYRVMAGLAAAFVQNGWARKLEDDEIQTAINNRESYHDEAGNRYTHQEVETYNMKIQNPVLVQPKDGLMRAGEPLGKRKAAK